MRPVPGEEPIVSGIVGRYALALFELAQEKKSVDAVGSDLKQFDELVGANADLARLVRSPVFGTDEQVKAVGAVMTKVGISGLAANFIKLIASNRRLSEVSDMARGYQALVAQSRGEISADVTVAQALSDDNFATLKATLNKATGKDVAVNVKVDPGLIGGLIVKIGSHMIDASLKTKLQSIKIAMKEVG